MGKRLDMVWIQDEVVEVGHLLSKGNREFRVNRSESAAYILDFLDGFGMLIGNVLLDKRCRLE